MSVYLHGLAMRADLSANLKTVLMALCDAAGEDDGTKCYPSLDYLRYKSGFSERHVRRLLRTLELAGYIEPYAFVKGGRGHTTWYRIHMKRVPMKPAWNEVKARLIEEGKLAPDDDIPPGAELVNPEGKRAKAIKGDKMSAFSENSVKGDKMSAFNGVKGDKMSAFSTERGTKCPPSILSSSNIPSKREDSYSDSSTQEKVSEPETKPDTGERAAAAPSSPTPPFPPSPQELAPGDMEPSRLWGRVVATLQAVTPAAQMASWIYPARLARYGWDADETLRAELLVPGSAHARMIEDRYGYLITDALARVYNLPVARVALSIECAPQVTRSAAAL